MQEPVDGKKRWLLPLGGSSPSQLGQMQTGRLSWEVVDAVVFTRPSLLSHMDSSGESV